MAEKQPCGMRGKVSKQAHEQRLNSALRQPQVEPAARPIVASLTALFKACAAAAAASAGKRREMDDNAARLGKLLWALNARQVSAGVQAQLLQLCAALDAGDLQTASAKQARYVGLIMGHCLLGNALLRLERR